MENINQKIANCLNGTATEKQRREVEDWIKQSNANSFESDELKKYWVERTSDPKAVHHDIIKSKVWNTYLTEQIRPAGIVKRRFYFHRYWKLAAVILLFILSTIMLIYNQLPGRDVSDDIADEIVIKQNPSGQKSQFQLPDGSKVWLNSESSISFPENFTDSMRVVSLEGEAYFEVKHNPEFPFVVQTKDLSISVLGTGFNVSAYQADNDITVALIHGAIEVQFNQSTNDGNILMAPGEGIAYFKDQKGYRSFSILEDNMFYNRITKWKHGALVFDGQDFNSFITDIGRWYGLNVTVSGEPPEDWRIRASFDNEYLENIMEAVSFNKDFTYELMNKELKIMFY